MHPDRSQTPRLRRGATAIAATLLTLGVAEAVTRAIDRQPLTRLTLASAPVEPPLDPAWAARADRPYVNRWPLAHGVQEDWYDRDPAPRARIAMPSALRARYEQYPHDPEGAPAR